MDLGAVKVCLPYKASNVQMLHLVFAASVLSILSCACVVVSSKQVAPSILGSSRNLPLTSTFDLRKEGIHEFEK